VRWDYIIVGARSSGCALAGTKLGRELTTKYEEARTDVF